MLQLERLSKKPILTPIKNHDWERSAVFNAAAVYHEGLVYMIYRATDIPPHKKYGNYISRLGLAISQDGINFARLDKPIFSNDTEQEKRGVEDPRIVKIGDKFYMLYTGFGGRSDSDFRICLAVSTNLITWERRGVVLNEPNKDASLFPEKIGGKYVLLHRRYPNIWIAFSDDLKKWEDHQIILKTIPDSWESARIGIAGPPIKTEEGWLLLYHAADDKNVYRLGAALVDKKDPTKVLARQKTPILEPELDWEINGYIPNVVFSCGQVEIGDNIYVYYGGADTVIGVARLNKKEIVFN